MKSQPEITIRRLAVFGGYGDLEAPTAWTRRPASFRPTPTAGPRAAEAEATPIAAITAIPFGAPAPSRDLPVAA